MDIYVVFTSTALYLQWIIMQSLHLQLYIYIGQLCSLYIYNFTFTVDNYVVFTSTTLYSQWTISSKFVKERRKNALAQIGNKKNITKLIFLKVTSYLLSVRYKIAISFFLIKKKVLYPSDKIIIELYKLYTR